MKRLIIILFAFFFVLPMVAQKQTFAFKAVDGAIRFCSNNNWTEWKPFTPNNFFIIDEGRSEIKLLGEPVNDFRIKNKKTEQDNRDFYIHYYCVDEKENKKCLISVVVKEKEGSTYISLEFGNEMQVVYDVDIVNYNE